MKKFALLLLLGIVQSFSATQAQTTATPPATADQASTGSTSRLGINLNGVADWCTEFPFTDLFHQARLWISQKESQPWGKGPPLELDEHGWVKKLEADCSAQSPVFSLPATHLPQGSWTLLYEGEGKISLWPPNTSKILSEEPGKITFQPSPDANGTCNFHVVINSTNPDNYIRNIHVLWPGTESTWKENPFSAELLAHWKPFNTIRYMDWMSTNGSAIKEWADRPKPDDAVWTNKGIPLETIIDLSNRTMTNPWINIPHLASDDYVHHFAQYVKEHLNPKLKVHIEFSNEVWNGMFQQAQWAQEKATERKIGEPTRPWEGRAVFYVQRSLEIFKIFEQEFGGTDRLVRILAWQAAASEDWTDGRLLSQPGVDGHVDALAIAPYMTFCIPAQGSKDQPGADEVATWSLDQLFDQLQKTVLPQSIKWMETQKGFADKHGLKLMAYESGQHLVGVSGGENNEPMTKLFNDANRDPRMGALYTQYLDAWKAAGGDTMCLFSSIGPWGKSGSWGLMEFYDQTAADEPKYKAVTEWNAKNPR
jgi:hypothetical protein